MVRWFRILIGALRASLRTRQELALENLALRQQVAVWKVRQPRPHLAPTGRIFWVVCRGSGRTGGMPCMWCGLRQWCGGTVGASDAIGHGRAAADAVGP